ncbi:TPA: hypothetical protein N0F65_003916 [Lagenidium giganteum]|uniref:Uncharacterized protein n=1 Tax=Lagenidium giganteum TaxID=4803 RepID=A0AAV2ZA69_9STRA|nr:TPA: hypothetical protein N0F65_003916 [Lagenidium giganteum]
MVMLKHNDDCLRCLEPRRGGSRPGKRANIDRSHAEGHARLFADYFAYDAVYTTATFQRRFRMPRDVFVRIHDAVVACDGYFVQRPDATGGALICTR